MASTADPPDVGKAKDDEILDRFVAARDAGDEAAMRREWGEVTEVFFERVTGMVRTKARHRLSRDERDEAEGEALRRFSTKLVWSFEGTSVGELVNATKQVVRWAIADVQCDAAERSKHETSLDGGYGGDDDAEPYAGAMRKQHDDGAAAAADHESDADFYVLGRDFLAWALPRLGERRRIVMELDAAGASTEEMQEALGGATRDVVYQTRRRALKELDKLKEQYSS